MTPAASTSETAVLEQETQLAKRLDVLVNDISEGDRHDWQSFWKVDVEKGFMLLRNALHTHIITCRFAAR